MDQLPAPSKLELSTIVFVGTLARGDVTMNRRIVCTCFVILTLGGCMTTSMPVTGRAQGYYFVREEALKGLTEAARRQYILARRERQGANAPASVAIGETYRFVPICGRNIAWDRPTFETAVRGKSIELTC